jgi:hypothetical protein
MYLHEEYIKRHNLKIPVVLYRRKSSVFLKSKEAPHKWGVLAFCWHEPDRHPGFWDVGFNDVVHNGYAERRLLKSRHKVDFCYSDDYEEVVWIMVNYAKEYGFAAVESGEQVLAAWQIFLMMYDSWLAEHMEPDFFKLVGESLDPSKPRDVRLRKFEAAQRELIIDRTVNDVWMFNLLPLAKPNSEWLIRLINE